jgi:SAM-dependent methyltransferase
MDKADKYVPEKYWEERLCRDFSLTGVGHLGFSLEYNKWLYKSRLSTIKRVLKDKNINYQEKSLLDIGVGTGFYIPFWEKLGIKNITGIDITTKSVEELKKKYPKYDFIKADISEQNLPLSKKFDIITAFDVLFHIIDEEKFEQAIRNIKKFSHKNAVILIMDNFLKKYKPPRYHEYDRTLEYYKKIMISDSIKIIDVKPIFYFMNAPIDIEREHSKFNRFLIKSMWRINNKIGYLRKFGVLGKIFIYLWAAVLYYLDRTILNFISTGPSTKLLVAKYRGKNNE